MALNVTGQAKVFKLEEKGNLLKCSLGLSKKNKDGAWENEWYNANFFKDAKEKAKNGIPDKTKIEIKNAFLNASKWNGKTYININIMDFDFVDGVPQPKPQQEFDIDSVNMDDLPF